MSVAVRSRLDAVAPTGLAAWVDGIDRDDAEALRCPVDRGDRPAVGGAVAQGASLRRRRRAAGCDSAFEHDLTLVTRNLRDVALTGVAAIDPVAGPRREGCLFLISANSFAPGALG